MPEFDKQLSFELELILEDDLLSDELKMSVYAMPLRLVGVSFLLLRERISLVGNDSVNIFLQLSCCILI